MQKAILILLSILGISLGIFAQKNKEYISLEEAILSKNKDTIHFIQLRRQKLSEFPKELLLFHHLKGLDLSRNKLQDIPDEISLFSGLEELNLSRNKFNFFPISLTRLKGLKRINFSWNQLTKLCDQIENLEHLEVLDLYNNEIWDFGLGIYNLKSLQALDLRGTMYGIQKHKDLTSRFVLVKEFLIDPPCNCMD